MSNTELLTKQMEAQQAYWEAKRELGKAVMRWAYYGEQMVTEVAEMALEEAREACDRAEDNLLKIMTSQSLGTTWEVFH